MILIYDSQTVKLLQHYPKTSLKDKGTESKQLKIKSMDRD